ncbi:hypothetical protein LMG3481_05843 [Achromobacter deleyi]|nr:hypothetical protein LMG3481_05843 [Achromobacter deleyi]
MQEMRGHYNRNAQQPQDVRPDIPFHRALVAVLVGQQVVQRHGVHEHAGNDVMHGRQHRVVEAAQRAADHDVAAAKQVVQTGLVGVRGPQFGQGQRAGVGAHRHVRIGLAQQSAQIGRQHFADAAAGQAAVGREAALVQVVHAPGQGHGVARPGQGDACRVLRDGQGGAARVGVGPERVAPDQPVDLAGRITHIHERETRRLPDRVDQP